MLSDHQSEGTHLLMKLRVTIAGISFLETLPTESKACTENRRGKKCHSFKECIKTGAWGAEACSVGLPLCLIRTSGMCSTIAAQKHNSISSLVPFPPITSLNPKKTPKQTNNKTHRKQCYVEASVSPQRYWPTEPKWNKFPQLELKRAWQVYRTCMNLTSEQKSLLSRGSCPLLFFSQHLKAGTSHEKFMQQCVSNIAMKDPQHLLTWANPDG